MHEFDESEDTGTPDPHYNLISVLYHALQGAETCGEYVEDAAASGDEELTEFFRQVVQEEKMRAHRAKQLLARRLSEMEQVDEENPMDDEEDEAHAEM